MKQIYTIADIGAKRVCKMQLESGSRKRSTKKLPVRNMPQNNCFVL